VNESSVAWQRDSNWRIAMKIRRVAKLLSFALLLASTPALAIVMRDAWSIGWAHWESGRSDNRHADAVADVHGIIVSDMLTAASRLESVGRAGEGMTLQSRSFRRRCFTGTLELETEFPDLHRMSAEQLSHAVETALVYGEALSQRTLTNDIVNHAAYENFGPFEASFLSACILATPAYAICSKKVNEWRSQIEMGSESELIGTGTILRVGGDETCSPTPLITASTWRR
jgi:hypothetical protein